jgi:DNA (cytosine-5)-methyltransferase 1
MVLFSRFVYDSVTSAFTDVDRQRIEAAKNEGPPHNCSVCLLVEQRDQESFGCRLPTGVAYHGINFHIYDFALIRADEGPCHVGHIIDITFPRKFQRHQSTKITVRLLGRVSRLGGVAPRTIVKDEVSGTFHRHSYFYKNF